VYTLKGLFCVCVVESEALELEGGNVTASCRKLKQLEAELAQVSYFKEEEERAIVCCRAESSFYCVRYVAINVGTSSPPTAFGYQGDVPAT
jgi:hypothetical protein